MLILIIFPDLNMNFCKIFLFEIIPINLNLNFVYSLRILKFLKIMFLQGQNNFMIFFLFVHPLSHLLSKSLHINIPFIVDISFIQNLFLSSFHFFLHSLLICLLHTLTLFFLLNRLKKIQIKNIDNISGRIKILFILNFLIVYFLFSWKIFCVRIKSSSMDLNFIQKDVLAKDGLVPV